VAIILGSGPYPLTGQERIEDFEAELTITLRRKTARRLIEVL